MCFCMCFYIRREISLKTQNKDPCPVFKYKNFYSSPNHSFSFAGWYNPEKVNFGALRVLNDDVIAPKMGFGTHPHDNMEIITIPLKGVLNHRDSMHNQWQSVKAGEVQVMSAGSGLQHSEINGSQDEYLNLFQIWIFPDEQNVEPRYDQKTFDVEGRNGKLQVLVTSMKDDSNSEALKVHQDVKLSRINLKQGENFSYALKSKNHGVYAMVVHGAINVDNIDLAKGQASERRPWCLERKN